MSTDTPQCNCRCHSKFSSAPNCEHCMPTLDPSAEARFDEKFPADRAILHYVGEFNGVNIVSQKTESIEAISREGVKAHIALEKELSRREGQGVQNKKWHKVILWLLGYFNFPERRPREGAYYWRTHLWEKLRKEGLMFDPPEALKTEEKQPVDRYEVDGLIYVRLPRDGQYYCVNDQSAHPCDESTLIKYGAKPKAKDTP